MAKASSLVADEFEDYRELHDPKIREHIRKSQEEYRAGKSRPAEVFLAELGGGRSRKNRQRRKRRR